MPAPLLMPVMVTVWPDNTTCWLYALGTVSVVIMPSAALAQCAACASAKAAGKPATMRSTGKFSMMTPVEKGKTCCALTFNRAANASAVARASAKPLAPVPALALPVLMTMARICVSTAVVTCCKCSRHTCTGAAQYLFWVNTPATALPSSNKMTVRSLRPTFRTPASAMPRRTPGTAKMCAGLGA